MDIQLKNITKKFSQEQGLKDISLTIKSGSLVALLGPSGSGKTTLLKLISGLIFPDQGDIFFDQTNTTHLSVQERRIGFVFQNYALFPHMSVKDNIAFGCNLSKQKKRTDIDEYINTLMSFLKIDHLSQRYPDQLSGGQKQRVAIGRALAIDPTILLLDEPFGALDSTIRRDLRRWIKRIHHSIGATTLFVTHDQEEAFDIADEIIVMNHGIIEQIGSSEELYKKPNNPFVAQFLGAHLHLPIEVKGNRATGPGLNLCPLSSHHLPDQAAILMTRPENITFKQMNQSPFQLKTKKHMGHHMELMMEDIHSKEIYDLNVPYRPDLEDLECNRFYEMTIHHGIFSPHYA